MPGQDTLQPCSGSQRWGSPLTMCRVPANVQRAQQNLPQGSFRYVLKKKWRQGCTALWQPCHTEQVGLGGSALRYGSLGADRVALPHHPFLAPYPKAGHAAQWASQRLLVGKWSTVQDPFLQRSGIYGLPSTCQSENLGNNHD